MGDAALAAEVAWADGEALPAQTDLGAQGNVHVAGNCVEASLRIGHALVRDPLV
mgnify:CR=1 FL=1